MAITILHAELYARRNWMAELKTNTLVGYQETERGIPRGFSCCAFTRLVRAESSWILYLLRYRHILFHSADDVRPPG